MECFICKKKFPSVKYCVSHINWYHKNENIFECHICDIVRLFTSLNSFQKHMNRHELDSDVNLASNILIDNNIIDHQPNLLAGSSSNHQSIVVPTNIDLPLNSDQLFSNTTLNDFKESIELETFSII